MEQGSSDILLNVTLDHKTSHKGQFFKKKRDFYIIWKLNK